MTDAKIYKPFTRRLIEAFGERLKTAVLFGSRARDEAGENSDHDIFVVIERLPDDPLERLKQVRMALLDVPLRVNIVAKTPEQVAANLTPLLLDICVDGICLYGARYFERFRRKALNALKQSGLTRMRMGQGWYWHFEKIPKKEWELTWEEFREL
jgi:predicted nucleotidyltransferase